MVDIRRKCLSLGQKIKWHFRKLLLSIWTVFTVAISVNCWFVTFAVSGNYLRISETNFYTGAYLVSTSKCRIPELKVWSLYMLSKVEPLPASPPCDPRINSTINGTIKGLTFVDKGTLLVNQARLFPLGLKISDIECCYQVVERVEQKPAEYNGYADRSYRFSNTCYPMKVETQPISGFVRVTCNLTGDGTKSQVKIHTDFHLLPVFPKETSSDSSNLSTVADNLITRKLEYWKKRNNTSKKVSPPPNVLIIGLDSTSRLNFKRMLPSVESLLRHDLQAVELKGYTKVGVNTVPNILPMLTSYSQEEWKEFGFDSKAKAWDNCSFIWKNFSDHNYLTAYIQDYPIINAFNYGQTGFVQKPTDFYTRPWTLAASSIYPTSQAILFVARQLFFVYMHFF